MDLLVRSWIIRALGFLLKFKKIVPIQMMKYYFKLVSSALRKGTWGVKRGRKGGRESYLHTIPVVSFRFLPAECV